MWNNDSGKKDETEIPEEIAQTTQPQEKDKELEAVKKELETKKVEVAELQDKLLRKQADYENSRKRLEKERQEAIRYATEGLVCELLPVIDALEHALDAANKNHDGNALIEGIKLISGQLKTILQKVGLCDMKAHGQPFNPEHHEAVQVVESEQHEENTVVQEFRKGYILSGRVIRPSMVAVAKKK